MPPLLDPSLIRIFYPKGYAVGVGFLVGDHHALTCAHVIASALDLRSYPETTPTDELTLDFPLIAPNQKLTARVVIWQIPNTGEGDVAVLEITSPLPEKSAPARLIQSADLWHHTFRAFGFPKGHENGTWATGRILGVKAGGWQQIESTEQTGYFVQPGFSGGPVWDERLGGVVGMIMEAEAATRAAFMSPVSILASAYPPLTEKIEQIITPASDAPAPGEPPFKGLLYFDVQDAPLFFGREALTEELAQRLLQEGSNFLAIVGASGSGKSSLARAGLIPALIKKNAGWIYRIITPTAHPLKELAVTLTADVESVTAATTLIDDLNADPRSLDIAVSRFLKRQNAPHLLLVVDQFEELFTACKEPAERKAFIDNLLKVVGLPQTSEATATSKVSIVLTLRADFYHHCAQYDNLRSTLETYQAYIGPMTTEELRRAIEVPARNNGLDFESGLVDLMLHDANDEPGTLPLLSHALLETWQRRKRREMTLAGYNSSGGVRGAIAQTADRVFNGLAPNFQRIARDIFLRLTEFGDGIQYTRRKAAIEELISNLVECTEVETVLKTLVDARLVITEKETAEVSHEALIREWPTLRKWLDKNQESLRLHRHLTDATHEWQKMGQDTGDLYRGVRLNQVAELLENEQFNLNDLERNFIKASLVEQTRQQNEREAIQQRELAQAKKLADEQKRSAQAQRQRSIYLTAGLIIAVILAILSLSLYQSSNSNLRQANEANTQSAFNLHQANLANTQSASNESTAQFASTRAIYQESTAIAESNIAATAKIEALQAQEIAESEAIISKSRGLSALAISKLSIDPELSLLLSIEALNTAYTQQAEDALRLVLSNSHARIKLLGSRDYYQSMAWHPNGSLLAISTGNKSVGIWNLKSLTQEFLIGPQSGSVSVMQWSSNGNYLALGQTDGEVLIWELSTNQIIEKLEDHFISIADLSWRSNSNELVVAGCNSTDERHFCSSSQLVIWEVLDNEAQPTLLEEYSCQDTDTFCNNHIVDVEWNPNGVFLAVVAPISNTSSYEQVVIWDFSNAFSKKTLRITEKNSLYNLAWSPDSKSIAVVGFDILYIWDFDLDKLEKTTFTSTDYPSGSISGGAVWVKWKGDGDWLAFSGHGNNIKVWNLKSGEIITLIGHQADITNLAWQPFGKYLASSSRDGNVIIWDISQGSSVTSVNKGLGYAVDWVDWKPDSYDLAFIYYGLHLWHFDTGKWQDLDGRTVHNTVAWNPSGNLIAVDDPENNSVKILDAENWEQLTLLAGHDEKIRSVAWNSNGELIATASEDDTVRIWDPNSGTELKVISPMQERSTDNSTAVVAWSPNDQFLAFSLQSPIMWIWDLTADKGKSIQVSDGFKVQDIKWSPDGTKIATAASGEAIIWDAITGEKLLSLGNLPLEVFDGVLSIAWSPDGNYLATGEGNGTVNVWNLETQTIYLTFHEHSEKVVSLDWSSDGKLLASGAWDYTAQIYHMNIEDLLMIAENQLPIIVSSNGEVSKRTLSQEEIQNYLVNPIIDDK